MNQFACSPDAPPSRRSSRLILSRLLWLTVLLAAGLAALVFPFGLHGRLWAEVFNLAHAPAFLLLLLLTVGLLDPAAIGLPGRLATLVAMPMHRVLAMAAGLLLLGLLGEFLQQFADRNPSWTDVSANVGGLLAGLCWIASRRPGPLSGILAGLTAVILVGASVNPLLEIHEVWLQRSAGPQLASFERRREVSNWKADNAGLQRSQDWSADGRWSLQVTLHPAKFSGLQLIEATRDWSQYTALQATIRNPDSESLSLVFKIYDSDHPGTDFETLDRFHQQVLVPPGQQTTVRIKLSDVWSAPATRVMDLNQIVCLEIFAVDVDRQRTFFVDKVVLE